MGEWSFLASHGRILVRLVQLPGASLRQIADVAGITERNAHRIVSDLEQAGYVKRHRFGPCNFYEVGLGEPPGLNGRRADPEMAPVLGTLLATQLKTPRAAADEHSPGDLVNSPADHEEHR